MLLKVINKRSLRLLGLLLSAVLLFSAVSMTAFAVTDEEKAEINDKIASIKQEIAENEKRIAELEEKASQYDSEISSLQEKIDIYQSQIYLINQEIALIDEDIARIESQKKSIENEITSLNNQIAALDAQVIEVQQQIADTYVLLGNRIRASYMSGPNSELEYLLTSEDFNFDAYLERVELISRIASHDDKLIEELEKSITNLQLKVAEIEDTKVRLGEKVKDLEKVQKDFDLKKQEQVNARSKVQASEDLIQADLDKVMSVVNSYDRQSDVYRDAISRAESSINAFEQKLVEQVPASHGSGSTGDMIWPLPYDDTYISSPFGSRSIGNHHGLDICRWAGTTGATVIAVKDGTVIETGYSPGGFGNYVGIDHGDGVQTYYAHLSAIHVSTGDYVTQGATIGAAGNTGYSFGAHLHIGVLVNGNWVNPRSVLSEPAGGVEVHEF